MGGLRCDFICYLLNWFCVKGVGPIQVNCSTEPMLINSVFNVTWSRPEKVGSVYDFVALYAHVAPNDQPLMYRYAANGELCVIVLFQHFCHSFFVYVIIYILPCPRDAQTTGQVSLQMPATPGLYEVRYIDAFTRETVALTSTIEAHLREFTRLFA